MSHFDQILFGVLPAKVFSPFSQEPGRHAYEAILKACIRGPFSSESVEPVSKTELQRLVEATLDEFGQQVDEELALRPAHVMRMMFQSGWFSEYRDGWNTFVEMDRAVATLAQFLVVELPQAVGTVSFGEGIASVDAMLQSAQDCPETHAQSILEAKRSAQRFAASVRAIAGNLRSIEQNILGKATINDVTNAFFDEFVLKIHAGDYRQLTSSANHPYRFRTKVIRMAEEMSSHDTLRRLAEARATITDNKDIEANLRELGDALDAIVLAMDSVELNRRRIDATKFSIERRFLNTIRQLDMADVTRDRRLIQISEALQALRGLDLDIEEGPFIGLQFLAPMPRWSSDGFRAPPKPRERVRPKPSQTTPPNPLLLEYKRAKEAFLASLVVDGRAAAKGLARMAGGILRSHELEPSTAREMAILHSIASLPVGPDGSLDLGDGFIFRRLPQKETHHLLDVAAFEVVSREFTAEEAADAD
jgi:hypothetical protein